MFYIEYRSISGDIMPHIETHGTKEELIEDFSKSVTPLVLIMELNTDEAKRFVKEKFIEWLAKTPAKKTGLRHSLSYALKHYL